MERLIHFECLGVGDRTEMNSKEANKPQHLRKAGIKGYILSATNEINKQ